MSEQHALAFYGKIQDLVSSQNHTLWVTVHPEQHSTALYHIDTTLWPFVFSKQAFLNPQEGATALLAFKINSLHSTVDNKSNKTQPQPAIIYVASTLGQIYTTDWQASHLTPVAGLTVDIKRDGQFEPILKLAQCGPFLVMLQATRLSYVNVEISHGATSPSLHQLKLTQPATTMAASDDGLWVAVGYSTGQITTFERQATGLVESAAALIHAGDVTALAFMPWQQRFFSAGSDQKLYLTHAQGALQPLDKGKNSNHGAVIEALYCHADFLYSGAADKTIKSWPIAGGQPVTCQADLGKMTGLSVGTVLEVPQLISINNKTSLRFLNLTDGKAREVSYVIKDAYTLAKNYLKENDPTTKQAGIDLLAQLNDDAAIGQLHKCLEKSQSKAFSLSILTALAHSSHSRAVITGRCA